MSFLSLRYELCVCVLLEDESSNLSHIIFIIIFVLIVGDFIFLFLKIYLFGCVRS